MDLCTGRILPRDSLGICAQSAFCLRILEGSVHRVRFAEGFSRDLCTECVLLRDSLGIYAQSAFSLRDFLGICAKSAFCLMIL